MITEGFGVKDGTTIDADVCIVGGGLAGLALAREFAPRGVDVVVLEGGGDGPEEASQALCAGEAKIADDGAGGVHDLGGFLAESRLRALGGAGNVWGAKCALLDECDFAARDWVEGSGWPFSRRDLAPFYDRACDLLHIRRFDYDPAAEFDRGRPPLALGAEDARFTTATRHLSPVRGGPGGAPTGALRDYKKAATDPANVDVILHGNAVEIETDSTGAIARAVKVATIRGNRFRVAAKAIVLATGGIENARLLLLSRTVKGAGLGNDRGLVGRYFSNHATFGPGAAIGFTSEPSSLDLYTTRDPRRVWGVLALALDAQRSAKLPNFTVTMGPSDGDPDRDDAALVTAAALADNGYAAPAAAPGAPVPVYFMSEAAPNAESRVTLGESGTDALGLPKARLEWRFKKDDAAALAASVRLLGRELGRTGAGRVRCAFPEGSPVGQFSPSRHHIGTTRMHADPGKGVVDANARVHGVENLFVAGSSVFPTAGIANPTLTLLALALKLADHLEGRLRR